MTTRDPAGDGTPRNTTTQRASWLRRAGMVGGVLLVVAGGALVTLYVAGVVDVVRNQAPDRSWLFWGLPIAMGGATLLAGGVGLMLVARMRSGRAE